MAGDRFARWALAVLLVVQFAWGSQYIFRTSFVHGGERVFTLWDDAMISMQYARNLREGNGLVWNVGDQPVQGFTNLGVTLVMAAIHWLPVSDTKIALVVQLVALALLTASTALCWELMRRLHPAQPPLAVGAALAIVLCAPLGVWSLQGSDVGFVTLWLLASAYAIAANTQSSTRLLVLFGIGLWIRPDTALFYLVLLCTAAVARREIRMLPPGLAVLVLTFAAQMGFSLWYYGDPLPNTYYLKATGSPRSLMLSSGLAELSQWLPRLLLAIVLASIALFRERRAVVWLWMSLSGVAWIYNIWVGGDFIIGYGSRFVVPTLPLLLMLAVLGSWHLCASIFRTRSLAQVGAFAICVVLVTAIANPWPATLEWFDPTAETMHIRTNRSNYNFARYLRSRTDESVTLAAHWGGVPVYFSDRRAYDVLGKSDRHIAKLEVDRFFPGHSKWDWDYVLEVLRPDVIRAPSRGLGERSDFRREYLKVETKYHLNFYIRRERAPGLDDPDAVFVDLTNGQRMRLRQRQPTG